MMDDANYPSLLALPLMGFVPEHDKTYQNTRKMLLDKAGNPYYLQGYEFRGIGGPHIGAAKRLADESADAGADVEQRRRDHGVPRLGA